MRFAVIGNCQTEGFRDALRAYFPAADVAWFSVGVPGAGRRAAEFEAGLDRCDRVFAQPVEHPHLGPLRFSELKRRHGPRLSVIPTIAFTGFHPDCVYLNDGQGALRGPMGAYHSALAAGAHAAGLDAARTCRLFNALLFGRLGYFAQYETSVGLLRAYFASLGLDLGDRPDAAWGRGAAFMHTINHPNALVIADLCTLILSGLGIRAIDPLVLREVMGDRLVGQPVWPVYPEIARRIGVPGSHLFRAAITEGQGIRVMDLAGFVGRSFAHYDRQADRVREAVRRSRAVQRVLAFLEAEGVRGAARLPRDPVAPAVEAGEPPEDRSPAEAGAGG
jgi:hypothetical protein